MAYVGFLDNGVIVPSPVAIGNFTLWDDRSPVWLPVIKLMPATASFVTLCVIWAACTVSNTEMYISWLCFDSFFIHSFLPCQPLLTDRLLRTTMFLLMKRCHVSAKTRLRHLQDVSETCSVTSRAKRSRPLKTSPAVPSQLVSDSCSSISWRPGQSCLRPPTACLPLEISSQLLSCLVAAKLPFSGCTFVDASCDVCVKPSLDAELTGVLLSHRRSCPLSDWCALLFAMHSRHFVMYCRRCPGPFLAEKSLSERSRRSDMCPNMPEDVATSRGATRSAAMSRFALSHTMRLGFCVAISKGGHVLLVTRRASCTHDAITEHVTVSVDVVDLGLRIAITRFDVVESDSSVLCMVTPLFVSTQSLMRYFVLRCSLVTIVESLRRSTPGDRRGPYNFSKWFRAVKSKKVLVESPSCFPTTHSELGCKFQQHRNHNTETRARRLRP